MDPKKLTQQNVFDVVADLHAHENSLREHIRMLEEQLWVIRNMRLILASPVPDEHPPVQPKYPLAYVPPTIPAQAGQHRAGGRYWDVKDAGPLYDRNDFMD